MTEVSKEYPQYERATLVCGTLDGASTRKGLEAVLRAMRLVPEPEFTARAVRSVLSRLQDEAGAQSRELWQPLNVALTSRPLRMNPSSQIARLGKNAALARIEKAILELSTVA